MIILFIYLLLYWVFAVCMGFSLAAVSGASLCCGAQVSHCGGLSCWDMWNLPGLGIKPSVPCVGRRVLIHCATREVSACRFYYALLLPLGLSLPAENPPAMWETWVRSLGWKDPMEKGKATHSSFLAWRIPWTQSIGLPRVGHDWATFTSLHLHNRPTTSVHHH